MSENITEAPAAPGLTPSSSSTSDTTSGTSKQEKPNELEAEEDDLPDEEYEPLSTTVIDDFAANALTGCLSLLDSLPDTVYRLELI